MSGTSDKFRGKAEELTGKITGDESLEAKGKARQISGELKDRAENMKDDVGDKINQVMDDVKDRVSRSKDDDNR